MVSAYPPFLATKALVAIAALNLSLTLKCPEFRMLFCELMDEVKRANSEILLDLFRIRGIG
jgi:hypothetical protein